MELILDAELVNKTKQRMIELLPQIKQHSQIYLKHQWVIEQTKSGKYQVFMQTGSIVYESRDETHWIFQSRKLVPNITPQQYAYRVLVINPKTRFFDTVYPPLATEHATEQKCLEYVLRWQETKYGFNWREHSGANSQLKLLTNQLNEMSLIVGDEFNAETNKQIDEIQNQIRKDLGIIS